MNPSYNSWEKGAKIFLLRGYNDFFFHISMILNRFKNNLVPLDTIFHMRMGLKFERDLLSYKNKQLRASEHKKSKNFSTKCA